MPWLSTAPSNISLDTSTALTSKMAVQAISADSPIMLSVRHSIIPRTVHPRERVSWSTSPTRLPVLDDEIGLSKRRTSGGHINDIDWLLSGLLCGAIVSIWIFGVYVQLWGEKSKCICCHQVFDVVSCVRVFTLVCCSFFCASFWIFWPCVRHHCNQFLLWRNLLLQLCSKSPNMKH